MSMFSKLLGMASGTTSAPVAPISSSAPVSKPSNPSKIKRVSSSNSSPSAPGVSKNPGYSPLSAQRRPVSIDEEQQQRIMRLKAARLAEQKKKEASTPSSSSKPKSSATKPKASSSSSSARSSSANKPINNTNTSSSRGRAPARQKITPVLPTPQSAPRGEKKKLNFKELMQQAEKVNADKMKVTVKVKTKTTTSTAPSAPPATSGASSLSSRRPISNPISRNPGNKAVPISNTSPPISRNPISRTPPATASASASGPISSAARKKKLMGGSSEPISRASNSSLNSSSKPSIRMPVSSESRRPQGGNNYANSSSMGRSSKAPLGKQKPESAPAPPPKPRAPAPFARPMKKLVDRRKERERKAIKSRYDEYDDEMDDFIVDDEEDGPMSVGYDEEEDEEDDDDYYSRGRSRGRGSRAADPGYDREEIWSLFSRGKRRADYIDDEDDLSDMEATGADLLQEEMRSSRVARQEDEAEERELKRLAAEKARKKRVRI